MFGMAREYEELRAANRTSLMQSEEGQKKIAMNFCVSHFRTEMEAKYCIEKILEDVSYDDGTYYKAEPLTM